MWDIREATEGQAGEIASLYVRTRRLAYAPFFPADVLAAMSVRDETEKWRTRLTEGHARTALAVDESGAIGGFTHFSWSEEPGEIEFMYVATEHQRNGLGAVLMSEAESRLKAAGREAAVLWVYAENVAARLFYERCGWWADGAERASDSAAGKFLVRYRRRLGEWA